MREHDAEQRHDRRGTEQRSGGPRHLPTACGLVLGRAKRHIPFHRQRSASACQRADAPRHCRGGGGVDVDRVAHVLRVAAGEHDAHRGAGAAQPVEHQLVAREQARLGEREPAEPVALPRIGAREKEREFGAGARNRVVERLAERLQIALVAGAFGEVDVEVGRDPLERVVAGAVQRQREAVRIRARAGRRCRRPGARRSRRPARGARCPSARRRSSATATSLNRQ